MTAQWCVCVRACVRVCERESHPGTLNRVPVMVAMLHLVLDVNRPGPREGQMARDM